MERRALPLLIALATSGCLFPEYTFDEVGGSQPTTTTGEGGDLTTTSQMGGGGAPAGGHGGAGAGGENGGGGDGGGGAPPVDLEDCTNGVDDDDDTMIDCADTGCATKAHCVGPAPAEWEGFFALYEGPASSFMGCPAEFPTQTYLGNTDIDAPAAECSDCMCGDPTGQQCTLPTALTIADAPCGTASFCSGSLPLPAGWDGACDGDTSFMGGQTSCGMNATMTCSTQTGVACNQAVSMNALQLSGGSCTPGTSTPSTDDPDWSTLGVACKAPDTTTALGCNASFSCHPRPSTTASFVGGLCVMRAGMEPCPPGLFSEQHIFYTGFTDDRGCGDCDCDDPSGATCSAEVRVYSNTQIDTCTTLVATLDLTNAAGDCSNLAGNPTVSTHSATIVPPSGGSCLASGGDPIGSALPDPTTATTFCCLN